MFFVSIEFSMLNLSGADKRKPKLFVHRGRRSSRNFQDTKHTTPVYVTEYTREFQS